MANVQVPRLDPTTTRLIVVGLNHVLTSSSGWPFRLLDDTVVALPLIAVRPEWADEDKPPAIAKSLMIEPDLRVGTIDELVEAYREYLETMLNKINHDPDDLNAAALTQASFSDVASGSVPRLFGGSAA